VLAQRLLLTSTHLPLGANRGRQNVGYINYTRIAWGDHSYAYDSSKYQDPPAHKKQKEADGAYKHRKVTRHAFCSHQSCLHGSLSRQK